MVENGNVVLSGGYVDLTDDSSDNSPSQSNNNEQIVKVHTVASYLCIIQQLILVLLLCI